MLPSPSESLPGCAELRRPRLRRLESRQKAFVLCNCVLHEWMHAEETWCKASRDHKHQVACEPRARKADFAPLHTCPWLPALRHSATPAPHCPYSRCHGRRLLTCRCQCCGPPRCPLPCLHFSNSCWHDKHCSERVRAPSIEAKARVKEGDSVLSSARVAKGQARRRRHVAAIHTRTCGGVALAVVVGPQRSPAHPSAAPLTAAVARSVASRPGVAIGRCSRTVQCLSLEGADTTAALMRASTPPHAVRQYHVITVCRHLRWRPRHRRSHSRRPRGGRPAQRRSAAWLTMSVAAPRAAWQGEARLCAPKQLPCTLHPAECTMAVSRLVQGTC